MSFLSDFYGGMPMSYNNREALIADKAVAVSLFNFYTACMSVGFDREQAFDLTQTMFESVMCADMKEDSK